MKLTSVQMSSFVRLLLCGKLVLVHDHLRSIRPKVDWLKKSCKLEKHVRIVSWSHGASAFVGKR